MPRDKHRNLVPPVARGRSAQRLKVLDHDLQIDEGARAIAPAVSHGVESMDGHPGRRQPFKHPRVTPHVLASERRLPVRERRLPVRERRFCEGPNRRVDESTSRRIDDERAPRRIRGGNTKPPLGSGLCTGPRSAFRPAPSDDGTPRPAQSELIDS